MRLAAFGRISEKRWLYNAKFYGRIMREPVTGYCRNLWPDNAGTFGRLRGNKQDNSRPRSKRDQIAKTIALRPLAVF